MAKKKQIALIGINHKSAEVDIREKFQINKKEILRSLREISLYDDVESVIIVSTCNRLEFYFVIPAKKDVYPVVKKFYQDNYEIDIDDYDDYFYTKTGKDVTNHLFRVISGIDSLVLGEYQIQGQVKEAYSLACKAETVETVMHKLFHAAFRTGKRVRSETTMGSAKQSVSGVASEILMENITHDDTVALIGVNENTKIIAQKLKSNGYSKLIFANRTHYKAEMMAESFGGEAMDLKDANDMLKKADAIFTSTGAPGYIITADQIKKCSDSANCPRLIIDMAVPRDIETDGLPEKVKVYDISSLEEHLEKYRKEAMMDLPLAEKIVANEARIFQAWSETQHNQLINPYAEKFEMIRQQVIEENRGQQTPQTIEEMDKMSRQLVHRLQSTFIRALVNMEKEKSA